MRLAAAMIIVGLLVWAAPVCAEELTLAYGSDAPEMFEGAGDRGYWIKHVSPVEWTEQICSEVRFLAKSYGDNSTILGTLVIYGPPETRSTFAGPLTEGRFTVLTRKVFELAEIGSEGEWVTVSFDPIKLPDEVGVVIYTYNTDERGVDIGLTPVSTEQSSSGTFYMEKIKKPDDTWTYDRTNGRSDGRNWLINVPVTNTLPPPEIINPADITGAGYYSADDGVADGFITSQKHGPMVAFDAGSGQTIDRVFVYGKLVGEWFECEKLATAYLLDKDYRIISREVLRYDRFVNEPAWGAAEFPDVQVSGKYYVLIEPLAKLDVQLEIGYDASSENQGSLWGTPGSVGTWDTVAPEEMTNWMIRAHSK